MGAAVAQDAANINTMAIIIDLRNFIAYLQSKSSTAALCFKQLWMNAMILMLQ